MANRRISKHHQLVLQISDTEDHNLGHRVEQVGEIPKKPIRHLKMLPEFKGRPRKELLQHLISNPNHDYWKGCCGQCRF